MCALPAPWRVKNRAPVPTLSVLMSPLPPARTSRAPVGGPPEPHGLRCRVMGFARTSRAPVQIPSLNPSSGRSSSFGPILLRGDRPSAERTAGENGGPVRYLFWGPLLSGPNLAGSGGVSARTSRAPVQALEVARTTRAPVRPPISVRLVMGFARTLRAPTQTPSVKVSPGRSSSFRPTLSRGIDLSQNEPPETGSARTNRAPVP